MERDTNVAAEDPRQAARVMAATASRSEELKELAGVKSGGRALEKPVCHYSLSWGKDEKPNLQAMGRAVTESLETMGLADRQAVMIAHRDTEHPHVHVVVTGCRSRMGGRRSWETPTSSSPGGRRDTNGSRGESVVRIGWRTTPGGIVGSGSGVRP